MSAPTAHVQQPDLEEERLARVALNFLTEPGDERLARLVAELGAIRVRDHLLAETDVGGLLTDIAQRLKDLDPERSLDRAARAGHRFVIPGDADWPVSMNDLIHVGSAANRGGAPIGLWVRGPLTLGALGKGVAIVGSRSATSYGTDVAAELAAGVGREGYAIISGAAYGIDLAAHRGALAVDAPTVAVLACGVDRAYPAAHRDLLDYLGKHGAVVSEAPPGGAPMRMRFLARNRLIAAMTRGTVIVEAAIRSGALNTAHWAERLSRCVMGVPGPVTSAPSQGVHQLIRSGAATLVGGVEDVLELLGESGDHLLTVPRAPERSRDRLNVREQQVLDAVPFAQSAGVDSVARAAGIGLVEVRSILERLRQRHLVVATQAGWRLTEASQA
jgi:DNA processing protein